MLKPVEMKRVQLVLPKSQLSEVVVRLHELGMVEITPVEHSELSRGSPSEEYDDVSAQLIRMRSIKQALAPYAEKGPMAKPVPIERAWEKARALQMDAELEQYLSQLEKLRNEDGILHDKERQLRELEGLGNIDFSMLRSRTLDYWLGRMDRATAAQIEKAMEKQRATVLSSRTSEREQLLLIVYPKGKETEETLAVWSSHAISVPAGTTVPGQTRAEIRQKRTQAGQQAADIKEKIHMLAKQHYATVVSLEKALGIAADRAQIPFRFGTSARTAFVEGWICASDAARLTQEMKRWDVAVHFVTSHAIPPTLLDNPKPATPFEFITKTFSLPNAREIDPTSIYLITLPLIYGMIVGDVVYGIISFFIAKWILQKFQGSPTMQNVGKIWLISVLPTIVFGILFDEWAGMDHVHLIGTLGAWGLPLSLAAPLYKPFVHRIEELSMLIGITVVVGLVHLAIGFALGAINEWHHNKKHAIAKLAWIWMEVTGTLAAGGLLLHMFPPEWGTMGAVGVVLGAIVLFLTEGVVGILEIPGLAGNVLSYARIAAIGVVGVALAEIINEVFLPLPEQGWLALLFFPLFILLHGINTFIAMFESLIQGGRLNIIEFRSKFLKGGGKPFEPFAYSYR